MNIPKGCDLPPNIKTSADLLTLFSFQTELESLTLLQKKIATLLLIKSYNNSSSFNHLPTIVVDNLVTLFGSTNKLFFYSYSQKILNPILNLVTVNHTLQNASSNVQIQFLEGLFSLSPGVIENYISNSTTISLLGTVSTAENINALSRTAVMNLMTVISLSNSLIKSLPVEKVSSLLTFLACKSQLEMFITLPPSTIFSFMDGLLDTLNESKFKNGIPDSAVVTLLHFLMTSRLLSVFPGDSFNQLLAVLSASENVTKALPPTNIISLFNILKTSPVIIKSLNHNNIANVLITVASTPKISNSIPKNLFIGVFQSLSDYMPSIDCILIDLQTILGITIKEEIITNVC